MDKRNPVGDSYDLGPGASGIERLPQPQSGSPDAAPPSPPANASPPLRESYGLTKRPDAGASAMPDHPITGGVDSERAHVRAFDHPYHVERRRK
jgi:hypothetical protein